MSGATKKELDQIERLMEREDEFVRFGKVRFHFPMMVMAEGDDLPVMELGSVRGLEEHEVLAGELIDAIAREVDRLSGGKLWVRGHKSKKRR
jgi:hypothetical protein